MQSIWPRVESMQHVVGRIAAVSEPSGMLGWRAGSSMNAPPPRRGTPAIQSASPPAAAGAQEPGIPAPAHPHTFPGQGWRQGLSIHFTSFKVYVVLIYISSSNHFVFEHQCTIDPVDPKKSHQGNGEDKVAKGETLQGCRQGENLTR